MHRFQPFRRFRGCKSLRSFDWRYFQLQFADPWRCQPRRNGPVVRHRARPDRLRAGELAILCDGRLRLDLQSTVADPDRTGNNVTPFLWRLGWAAGAGVEVPIAPHWTARLEYLFTDYGKTSLHIWERNR